MKILNGLVTAGTVFLHAASGTEAKAQDCNTNWANPYAFMEVPSNEWNMDLIASMGAEKVQALAAEVSNTLQSTLNNQVANVFDGINDAVVNDRAIDWKSYKDEYDPLFTPILEKAEADFAKDGADKTAILATGRNEATLAAMKIVLELSTTLLSLDTSKPACANKQADAGAPAAAQP